MYNNYYFFGKLHLTIINWKKNKEWDLWHKIVPCDMSFKIPNRKWRLLMATFADPYLLHSIWGTKYHHLLFLYTLWKWEHKLRGHHSMHLLMNSRNLFAYWSWRTVENSAPAPCFTVFAAVAVRFFTPYFVRMSIIAKK